MNKKLKYYALRFVSPFSWMGIGFIMGIGTIVLWYCFSNTIISSRGTYDKWEVSAYLFEIIGSIATFLAVVVALTKESILKWLYSPKFDISLVDNGITEIIRNENERTPEAISHECHAQIENIGSLAALGCRINISDIRYSRNGHTNCKSIKGCKRKQLYWTASEVDIPVNISNRIRLFEILNPDRVGTPQENTPQSPPPQIKFNGCELILDKSKKGYWEVEYYISCRSGEATRFILTVEWNGEFKGRAEDMKYVLSVNIERK